MNVLFILLDDLGWNDVGVHNNLVRTPNIDYLVQDGCELLRNYTFPVCGPTRAMIQTGIYAYKYGMQKLFDPWVNYGLDENLKIIPEYLNELGFSSYAIGKWHLGHNLKKFLPSERGYRYHYGSLTGCVHHTNYKHCNIDVASKHDFSENGKPIYPNGHMCDLLTDKCLEIIENSKSPFFIYLAHLSPHVPLVCPENFKNFYTDLKDPRKSYLGMISHLDFQLGRIIEKLKEKKIYDETLIWLMSDNGGWNVNFAGGENFPLKGGKASFYEGGSKTFSVIKHKSIGVKKLDDFVHCVDVLPTILSFCGYEKNVVLDGVSIYDALVNGVKNERRFIVLGFYGENHWCFVIDNLKFIKLKKTSNHHLGVYQGVIEYEDLKFIECYDLIKDAKEENNIITEKYNLYKNELEQLIKSCLKHRVYESFKKFEKNEIYKICKDINFWGQQNDSIKFLNIDEEQEDPSSSIKFIESKETLLELTGYDVFVR